jgi:DNA-binding transcriptional regulator YbjK
LDHSTCEIELRRETIRSKKVPHMTKAADHPTPSRRGRPLSTARRTRIADAAIEVVARAGARGLNHRAIDRLLKSSGGSTSYYYPRRIDLINAAVKRMTDVHMKDVETEYAPILVNLTRIDAQEVSRHVVSLLLRRLRSKERLRTIAYFELSIDGTRHPEYRRVLQVEARAFWKMWETIFVHLGARDPKDAARAYATFLLGQLYMYAVRPEIKLDKAKIVEIFHGFMLALLK